MTNPSPRYDQIGLTYSRTRKPDPRIVEALYQALQLNDLAPDSEILDVGAGTGNYSRALAARGFRISALEPSSVMIEQGEHLARESGLSQKISFIQAPVESIPFPDRHFQRVVSILATHHFSDLSKAMKEISRVTSPGAVIAFLTADPREKEPLWVDQYFGFLTEEAKAVYPPLGIVKEQLSSIMNCEVHADKLLLPRDCEDLFYLSGWARPELYLDPYVRAGISHFAKAEQNPAYQPLLKEAVHKLEKDLGNDTWNSKYASSVRGTSYDGGYRILWMVTP